MMAGSHVALGAAAWMAAAPHFGQPALEPVALGLAALGGLLPDVDHPKSWVGKRLRPVSDLVAGVFGHRGITHSLLAVFGCWWLLRHQAVPPAVAAPVVVGYLSHLFGDLLTPGGLRLSWPFKGTWALPVCRTGSAFEPLVVALLIAAALATVPEPWRYRPDPRAALEKLGVCWQCQAPPMRPPKRRLADQTPRGTRG